MATVSSYFKPMVGTRSSFENIKSNYKDLVQIEEIWLDKDTGKVFFIIAEDSKIETKILNGFSFQKMK